MQQFDDIRSMPPVQAVVLVKDGQIVVWGARKNICRDLQSQASGYRTSEAVGKLWKGRRLGHLPPTSTAGQRQRLTTAAATSAIDAVTIAVVGALGSDAMVERIIVLSESDATLAGMRRYAEEVSGYLRDTDVFEQPMLDRNIQVFSRVPVSHCMRGV